MFVIETNRLSRTYKSYKKTEGLFNSINSFFNRQHIEKVALHPLDLKIENGKIIGLVGANGAGKTTLLKILSGLIHPSSGDVDVLGYKPYERSPEFLKQISILLGQKNQLWWDIPALDSFELLSKIYDLDRSTAKKRVNDLAELLQCKHVLNIQLRRLSLGERMKMEIIGALLHKPKVLFLDEPTIGLDIMAQNIIRTFLQSYVALEKPTIILTSHYMDDIAKLADRLLLMSQGQIVYDGTVAKFMHASSSKRNIVCHLIDEAKSDHFIASKYLLKKGSRIFDAQVSSEEVPLVIQEIFKSYSVQDLKLEEANFEEVIHNFLSQEHSLR